MSGTDDDFVTKIVYMDGPKAGETMTDHGVPAKGWAHALLGGKYVIKSRYIEAFVYWQPDETGDSP